MGCLKIQRDNDAAAAAVVACGVRISAYASAYIWRVDKL